MARLMSVTLTEDAVVARRKTQTRRLGWLHARVGDELDLCRKVMGRKKGDPLVRLARVRITEVRREPLDTITSEEVELEGFTAADWSLPAPGGWVRPSPTPAEWFVRYFSHHMRCDEATEVTVITWEYLT